MIWGPPSAFLSSSSIGRSKKGVAVKLIRACVMTEVRGVTNGGPDSLSLWISGIDVSAQMSIGRCVVRRDVVQEQPKPANVGSIHIIDVSKGSDKIRRCRW